MLNKMIVKANVRSLAFVLVALLFARPLEAQRQPPTQQAVQSDSAGNCELKVDVRTRNERTIEAPFQVEVHTARGLIATAHIFGNEPAQFQVVNGKTYQLKVKGNTIDTVTTAFFEINPLETIHTETVYVEPKRDQPATESAPGPPTVSVSELHAPKKASAEMNKGMDAYAKGDLENAAAHFEKAVAEYPEYARAYDMLGAIAMKGADRDNAKRKAKDFFSKAIAADDSFWPAYVDLARMDLQDQDYAGAESLLGKVIAANPSRPDAMALLATTEFANKEYDKGLADVQRTHELANHQQFAEVHAMAGKVLRMQNRTAAAVTEFQLFLMEKPDSAEGDNVRKAVAELMAAQKP
ncbi:MAG: hypothetical protein NVS9B14_05850 [Candidatus Acidiferrum sp.]